MRLRSQRTRLLSLPDELLSTIILETMWATTIEPSNPPDLLMYERRLTNHPSIERKKVAFVGHICGRLRIIAQLLLKPAQLWEDPDARVEVKYGRPVVVDAPASLSDPAIRAIAFSRGQAVFLPQVPSATLEQLSDLSVSGGNGDVVVYSDEVLHSIGSCTRLQNLFIIFVVGSANGINKLFADIASIPTLQSLAIDEVYEDIPLSQALSLALGQTWSAPLVRLEVVWCGTVTFRRFLELMGKVAATIQVAIFHHNDDFIYPTGESSTAVIASFKQLWRLDVGFGYVGHRYATRDSTPAGRQQFAECSPLATWKAAPRLECFDCSEQIVIKTQKELDEVGELRGRAGMKRLRIKLDTWEGNKGVGWSTDKMLGEAGRTVVEK